MTLMESIFIKMKNNTKMLLFNIVLESLSNVPRYEKWNLNKYQKEKPWYMSLI